MPTDSLNIQYTGPDLTNIPAEDGDNLQTILINIDEALTNTSAPNYSGYDLACITQIDGVSHPTNTQNFAEGISKIVCDNYEEFDDFVTTTYATDKNVFETAITNLQEPEYTYAPFSIADTDDIDTVFSKMFTGFTGYNTALNPSGANWATLTISPAPTTVTNGFNSLITYLNTLTTTVNGKQATLSTFNNTSNCLAGGATDSAVTTIGLLTSYVCNLPEFDASDVETTCLSTQSSLQEWVQHLVDTLDGVLGDYVARVGSGITLTTGTGCNGKSVAVDATWTGLRKVGLNSSDSTYSYLEDKILEGNGISITQVSDGGFNKIEITNDAPYEGKLKINNSDTLDGYLREKLDSSLSTWGLYLDIAVAPSNNKVVLTPNVLNPYQFTSKLFDYIESDPSLLARFKQIMDMASGDLDTANPATNLIINI